MVYATSCCELPKLGQIQDFIKAKMQQYTKIAARGKGCAISNLRVLQANRRRYDRVEIIAYAK